MSAPITIQQKIEPEKLLKAAAFRKDIRITKPHKHNSYLEVILLLKGSGTHTIDNTNYTIQPPVVHIVREEQVHHWKMETEPDGFVLILKHSFAERNNDPVLFRLMEDIRLQNAFSIEDATIASGIFLLLIKVLELGGDQGSPTIEGLVKALLSNLYDASGAKKDLSEKSGQNYYTGLYNLLYYKHKLVNHVAWYAAQLNTTPQNLNHSCRKACGLPASEVIAKAIIAEAKRLLSHFNTVAEVANQLDFKDASHFSRYFKRHTGTTPHQLKIQ